MCHQSSSKGASQKHTLDRALILQGDGAWEPKLRGDSQPKKVKRGRKRRAADVSESTSSGGDISELANPFLEQEPAAHR